MKDFRKLQVWEKAHALTLSIYRCTGEFPREELYGVTSQMRRASASVAANITEGYGRGRDGEFSHFLNTAAGSVVELEYFLVLTRDLGILPIVSYDDLQKRIIELQKMLSGLQRCVASTRNNTTSSKSSKVEARSS